MQTASKWHWDSNVGSLASELCFQNIHFKQKGVKSVHLFSGFCFFDCHSYRSAAYSFHLHFLEEFE